MPWLHMNYNINILFIPDNFTISRGHKYKQPGSLGYANAILQHIPDGKEAIEAFFECLDEFLSVNGFEKIERI